MRALRDVLKYDGLYPNINRVTTLTNNHDTDRFMPLKDATREGAKLHVAFMLATRGIPQLYYGEEILMTGGHDPDNRKDFPGGWREDTTNKFTEAGRTKNEQEMFEWVRKWIRIRRGNVALKSGITTDLYYDNDLYIFERRSRDNSAYSILIGINNSAEEKVIKLKIQKPFYYSVELSLFPIIAEKNNVKVLKTYYQTEWEIELSIEPKNAIAYWIVGNDM